jgi:hypothetical protein
MNDKKTVQSMLKMAKTLTSDHHLPIEAFVGYFLRMNAQFYLFHWQTFSHAQHLAWEAANEDMGALMDAFVESYQGKYGRVEVAPNLTLKNIGETNVVEWVQGYRDWLVGFKQIVADYPKDDDLANIVDEMVARLNKLLYLLTLN